MKKIPQKEYVTDCDMGTIKIYDENMACFFNNGVGDVPTKVIIRLTPPKKEKDTGIFQGHFTVKKKAYLSAYDCDDIPKHEFTKGRYFVTQHPHAILVIDKIDEDIDS